MNFIVLTDFVKIGLFFCGIKESEKSLLSRIVFIFVINDMIYGYTFLYITYKEYG